MEILVVIEGKNACIMHAMRQGAIGFRVVRMTKVLTYFVLGAQMKANFAGGRSLRLV